MTNKDLLEKIDSNISELHRDYFFGGRKRRETHNFIIGILIGIGISLMVEAGIQLYLGYSSFNLYSSVLSENNLTMQNLPLFEQIDYGNLLINNLHLMFIIAIGFLITISSFFYYASVNRHLFNHMVKYSYKLGRGETLYYILKRIECIFKEIKKDNKFRWVGGKIYYIDEKVVFSFYNKLKKFLMLEYDNKLIIKKNEIILLCQTSNFGEDFGLLIEEFLEQLKKNKIITNLKREKRT